jgi:meso-butanediol dehydrogenase/(S,S)-butanediol dehydrogenase/diacetyl reductase
MKRFDGKVCLVTGAAAGIGRASALRLAEEGASVMAADINEAGAQEVAALIRARGARAEAQRFDAMDEASCRDLVAVTVERLGQLDVLCNIAGACRADHFLELKLGDWERMFRINVGSVMVLCQAAIPHLKTTRGNIVTISSASAIAGAAYWSAYGASKAAVASLMRALAVEFSADGIRANAICPGGVNTGLASTYSIPADIDPVLVQRLFPLCEAAEPEEIAAAVAYIGSSEARYVNGVSFGIDGGQLL